MSPYYLLLALTPFHADARVGKVLFEAGVVIVTPAKLVGLLAVIAAFAVPRPSDGAQRRRSIIPVLFAPFALVPMVATIAAGLPVPTATIAQFLSALLLLVTTRRLVRTRARLCKAVRVLTLAFAFSSLWVYKQHFFAYATQAWGVEGESNYEALMLLVALPAAFWMARYEDSLSLRRAGLAAGILLCGALVLTESRGGIIAGGLIGLLAALRSRHRLRNLSWLVGAALILASYGPAGLAARFNSVRFAGTAINGAELSTRIRVELAKAGLRMIAAHPVLGVGLEQFRTEAPKYNPNITSLADHPWLAHDTFIQLGAEGGIPMLLLFLVMLAAAFRAFRYAPRELDPSLACLGAALSLGLIGISIAALAITIDLLPFWLLMFFSVSFRAIGAAETRPVVDDRRPPLHLSNPDPRLARWPVCTPGGAGGAMRTPLAGASAIGCVQASL